MAGRILTRVRLPRVQSPAFVRAALGSALAALACLVALLSPALVVRQVAWTGVVQVAPARCQAVEKASRGRPLFLLPERRLRALLALEPEIAAVRFARHAPGTLEVRVTPRRAAAVTENGTVLDRHGRVLDAKHALPGVTRIRGFALADGGTRLEPESARLLACVQRGLARAGIAVGRVERRGDDLQLQVSGSDSRLLLSARAVDAGLGKLALLRPVLSAPELPSRVDLRFRDQIVIQARQVEVRRGRG